MDYRINNEALVGSVIMQVVRRGPYEIPFVIGMVNLLMQANLRKKAMRTPANDTKTLMAIYGRLNGDLLGVIVNSMTMLTEGGCLRRDGNIIEVTGNGLLLCDELERGDCELLTEVLSDINEIFFKYESIDTDVLYHQMWIDV
jgi:hypothetical protein